MGEELFMWYDSGRNGPCYGPHYSGDERLIGKRLYHSLDDLLKINLSDSIKKRLKSAKIDTKIKIHYLHSNGDLMVKRITEAEARLLNNLSVYNDTLTLLDKEKSVVEKSREEIINRLFPIKVKY